jgi:hypothetical protein
MIVKNRNPGRPLLRAKNKGGAPKGNRNAFKTGVHTAEARALRARIRAWHRRAAALLRAVSGPIS